MRSFEFHGILLGGGRGGVGSLVGLPLRVIMHGPASEEGVAANSFVPEAPPDPPDLRWVPLGEKRVRGQPALFTYRCDLKSKAPEFIRGLPIATHSALGFLSFSRFPPNSTPRVVQTTPHIQISVREAFDASHHCDVFSALDPPRIPSTSAMIASS